ncbi:MAG: hypothetical protein COX34_00170 [Candidatus Nealsonbacteria bacterium CG23_combo_of_CG06-09_8_20_14_all_36_12]|uniref:R3H domain-containing protein n=2 Tax=Candidatus Nealsoniibacteriota TaxID=1817911 RepID=A0A2H0TMQ0_9BACT|nr:MAG: hypothetical protein COX34_00170 [Candidatus Nealsonbacteria bacterium CG23_combo_of_CG06-09_8_20_14_all_36_12]PIR72836.1 MAG: hypothetical protein COV26_01735 [Candidatus Nealsonbacteria bacterium CG10_big_fil_rev_8_21_14_0_10_36_23]
MINQADLKTIKEIIEEFFQKMTIEVKIEVGRPIGTTIPINLRIEEPQILIGEKGQTLLEIQHLLKMILKKKIQDQFFIDLDIQDYKKKKIEYLKELARSIADEVVLTKKEKQLFPMAAYERRIIHLELASRRDVTTESVGEEPERRVVIRPHP